MYMRAFLQVRVSTGAVLQQEQRLQVTVFFTSQRKCSSATVKTSTVLQFVFQVQVMLLFTLHRKLRSLVLRQLHFLIQQVGFTMQRVSTLTLLRKSRKLREADFQSTRTTVQMQSTTRVNSIGQLSVMLLFHVLHRTSLTLTMLRDLSLTVAMQQQRALICLQLLRLQSSSRRQVYSSLRVRQLTQAVLLLLLLRCHRTHSAFHGHLRKLTLSSRTLWLIFSTTLTMLLRSTAMKATMQQVLTSQALRRLQIQ